MDSVSTDPMCHHPGPLLTSPSSKQLTVMPNHTAAMLVLAGTILRITGGAVHDLQERATKEIANMDSQESTLHKEVRRSQILKSEQDTCSVIQAIRNFTNPFTIEDKDALYCLSSGAPLISHVENDILMADEIGKKAHQEFVHKRLVEKKTSFHSPVKKNNLKTFATHAKSSVVRGKSRKDIDITAERNVFGQLVILALEHQVSLESVLKYPLASVPCSLGALIKTDKS